MFRFGKSQDSSRNNPELLAIPESEDLQFALSKAQRNWRTSVDLPFRVQDSSVSFTVVVKCEMGTGLPCWTLYRTDVPGSPVLWTHKSNDVLLIHNLISLEYTAASEKAAAESAGAAAAPSAAQAQPAASSSGVELNPYVARLQELGRYGSVGAETQTSSSPGSASALSGQAPTELPDSSVSVSKDTAAESSSSPPQHNTASKPSIETSWNDASPPDQAASSPAADALSARANAAQTYLDWLEGQKTIAADTSTVPTSDVGEIPQSARADAAKLKMSREIKLTRNSIEWSLSRSDTGILTYQAFVYFFENECIRFNRGGLPFSILLFDVRRESSFGSSALSPESMREVGERLRSFKRQLDVLAHFENDEGFVFLLPHTGPEGAQLCMDRVKQVLLEGESLLSAMDSSSIKFSCGIASMPENGTTPEDLLFTAREVKKSREF
ncbi:MAG: diguanylate cyclase [Candidatus Obscuribacterales bacterium]|nr:diguanylate cyclase [Candidatus Obscuribacterales bacterium]